MKNLLNKTSLLAMTSMSFCLMSAYAGSSAGSAPEGDLSLTPNQTSGGTTSYVAIGKELTFKAINLEDKDCCDGDNNIADSIKDPDGIKWVISQGTLDGGDKGNDKKWTAPKDPSSGNIGLKLEIDDLATAQDTTDDGGFAQVASWNVKVVIPNKVSMDKSAGSCPAGFPHGKRQIINDTLSYTGVTIDWSGLKYREEEGQHDRDDGCGLGVFSTGGPEHTVAADGTTDKHDRFQVCYTTNDSGLVPDGCESKHYCQWQVKAAGGSWHNVFKRDYVVNGNGTGKPTELTLTASIRSYD